MKVARRRIIEQCHVLRGATLLHLRLLFDGEGYTFDVHKLSLTTWKLLAVSVPGVSLSLNDARSLIEERALLACGASSLTFRWEAPTGDRDT
jgi:hypothetical protein